MLKKLVKYDLRATSRSFAPLYIVLMALAVLSAIFEKICSIFQIRSGIQSPLYVAQCITGVVYGIALFGVCLLTLVICMRYFYDNLFKDEGYLMHTLPVTPAKLIWGKVLTSALWGLATAAISIVSVLIVMAGNNQVNSNWFHMNWGIWFTKPLDVVALLVLVLTAVISVVFSELWACVSLSIASLVPKHHAAVGIGMFIVFGIIHMILIICVVASCDNLPQASWIMQAYNAAINSQIGMETMAIIGMLIASGYMTIFCVIYFAITQFIMKKHLNLQ
ncbi:MAG: hypothetical protein LKF71_07555 [Oscillospiraceae bacterium]|jgi:ABC-type transport system involved in multi-copper enzyme maturation permease subunit|nr:hypothetical protein [Oscillospiraceae bacterium]